MRQGSVRLVGATMAMALGVAACGGGGDSASVAPGSVAARDSVGFSARAPMVVDVPRASVATSTGREVDREATLRLVVGAAPKQWDPHRTANQFAELPYHTQVYDGLVGLTSENEIIPRIATEWNVSDDGLVYDFTLRDDVLFQDGTTLDAEAVVGSLERAREEESTVKDQFAAVAAVSSPEVGAVEITLSRPEPTLLYTLASPSGSIISAEAMANGADLQTEPVGSGPYRLVSQDQTTAVFERFEEYWDPAANPVAAKEIGFLDNTTRINALRTGQVDMIELPIAAIPDAQPLIESGEFADYPQASKRDTLLFMNVGMAPLDNPEVRRAINLAIDREGISEAVMHDRCAPMSGPFTEGFPGFNPDLSLPYDPDEATSIIEETGVGDIPLTILQINSAPNSTIAEVIHQALSGIGMNVSLVPVDSSAARPMWREGNDAFWVLSSVVLSPDPQSLMVGTYGPDLPGGLPGDIAEAAEAANALPLTGTERDAAWQGVAQMLNDQSIHAPICSAQVEWLARPNVVNVDTMPYAQFNVLPDSRYVGIGS